MQIYKSPQKNLRKTKVKQAPNEFSQRNINTLKFLILVTWNLVEKQNLGGILN